MQFGIKNPIKLKNEQITPAARVIARAFQNDPLMVYFFPSTSERKKKLLYLMKYLINYAIKCGKVYATSSNLEGIAVWLPSDKAHITFLEGFRNGGISLFFKIGIRAVLKQMSSYNYCYRIHKNIIPTYHWDLAVIGVDPLFQGKGFAGLLFKAMLTEIDRKKLSCFLETMNENNVTLYEHFGFKVMNKSKIPDTNITNWAMLRTKKR
ncbi:MAG: GNAT family N-acetyltransferase [Promethearchaeota archaeon]